MAYNLRIERLPGEGHEFFPDAESRHAIEVTEIPI